MVDGYDPDEPIAPPELSGLESTLPNVLVPGSHKDAGGVETEISNARFVRDVLDTLPQGTLYRMEREVGILEGPPGSMVFRPMAEVALRIVLDRHVRMCRWKSVSKTNEDGSVTTRRMLVYIPSTRDHAALVLSAAATHVGTRALKLLVAHPVYLPGLTLAQPGWNDAGVYYDEPPSLVGVSPNTEKPLDVLDDLFVDFPLKDEASRQNLYAAMLTRVLRPAIEGPTPFFLVMAPLERTGKGKLIDVASLAVSGQRVPVMQIGTNETEVEKRVTGAIMAGKSVLHLDNIPIGQAVDSASLASLATSYPLWDGRILGKSDIVSLPNRVVIFMSANNPKGTGEIVKRTVPIVLQPTSDHPELREDFKHPDCYAYALAQRPAVLSALLGIVEIGRSIKSAPFAMGGFERWSRIVTRAIRSAGGSSIMGNYVKWCAMANDENADAETLVKTWVRDHSGGELTATGILEMVTKLHIFPKVLSKPTDHGKVLALSAHVLTPMTDRPVCGWALQRTESGSNSRYYLQNMTP